MELWKTIPGFNGVYEVSSTGRVRRVKQGESHNGKVPYYLHGCGKRYKKVCLSNGGRKRMLSIHRLVAEAFIPNPENKPQVNHIDGDKSNNSADNLEWTTASENTKHAVRSGLITREHINKMVTAANAPDVRKKRGDSRGRDIIRDDGKVYPSLAAAARDLGLGTTAVCEQLRGRAKTCSGHTFRYLDSDKG